jgi:DNA polymerase III alpha subunit
MIQLRIRTEYSFGETYSPIDRVIARLKEIGCTAAGIVDQCSSWGHVRWFKKCKAAGIQPLLGIELVVCDEDDKSPRMWFLAKNTAGLQELYGWSSKTYQQPISSKRGNIPALRRHDVLKMSDNIFKFAGDITDADFLKAAGAYADTNPSSRVLNLQKHNLGLPVVGTSDNYYARQEDAAMFDMIGGGKKSSAQYILSELEGQDVATEIANACSDLALPKAPILRAEGNLEKLCRERIRHRALEWNDIYEERLTRELNLIKTKDFDAYFIVVADMVAYAKKHMLVGPSRGSSAGSLVCYLAGITEVDPIPPGLFFERFIDITRADLPDIDLDFSDNKRHMIFEYMAEKYGFENTAHIGTISLYKPKSALIQVCKKLDIPPRATAEVKVAMIERGIADSRAGNCLEDTLLTTDAGKRLMEAYPSVIMAASLEGHANHCGVHAAGLLVCNDKITNYATVDADGIAHVEKGAAEDLGLLKIDVLGLRTLGILEDSGIKTDWYNLQLNDPKVYEIFNKGLLSCIFQFEGQALRSLSKNIEFSSMVEIDAITALARPGPFGAGIVQEYLNRKNGKAYESIHPLVEEQMKETFGLPLYQEQTMAIVRNIGKFGWEETSFIRKGISKRLGKEFFDKFWPTFVAGAAEQGIDEPSARKVWELINSMGSWQMNKSHTYSYAIISYWCAWLKAYHPVEFAAANLRSAKDENSAIELLREMSREGIKHVAFDIDNSKENWSAKDGVLYGGFLSLHGFGEAKARKFVEARDSGALTAKMRTDISAANNAFSDIFPFGTKYGHLYTNPEDNGLGGKLMNIAEFDGSQEGSFLFIGEIVYKNSRNANEEVNVKKRKGKLEKGQLEFLDLRLRDDTATIGARINRFDYLRIGKEILETIPEGAHLLIRAKFVKGIPFGFIQKWKRMDA